MTAKDGGNTGKTGTVPSASTRDGGRSASGFGPVETASRSALPPSMAVGGDTGNSGSISVTNPREDVSALLGSGTASARARIALIAAMARNRVIGRDNTLPWRLPADMRRFRELTSGHPVLMGRRTFESLGRPLPQRTNIVLTSDHSYSPAGCLVAYSLEQALAIATAHVASDKPEIFVIGGENLYAQTLPCADRLYLTQVEALIEGDAWFPEFECEAWQVVARETRIADEKNTYDCVFLTLDRKTDQP